MHAPFPGIQLIINSVTAEELHERVVSLARQFNVVLPSLAPETKQDGPKETATKETVKEEKKSVKKTKEETKTEKPEETKEVKETKPETTSAHTVDDVKGALQKLSSVKGIAALKEFLATYKNKDGAACAKVSDVQVADYSTLINDVEEKLK